MRDCDLMSLIFFTQNNFFLPKLLVFQIFVLFHNAAVCLHFFRAKPEHHKFLIGRNGVNIQSVRDKTGARIIFPSEKDEDREVITILGTKESVASAKIELESRIKDLDKVVEEVMTVDPKHHKYFVARRGEVIRRIGDEFGGVVVSFPRQGVATDKVNFF